MNIIVLYGTETGNAEMLAEDMGSHLQAAHEATVTNMEDADPSVFAMDALFIIVSSTYGDGELPASGQAFYDALQAEKPDLKGKDFAVFGLGDSDYGETFGSGSQQYAELLIALGARQLGERHIHDVASPEMPEDVALPWVDGVLALYEAA